MRPFIQFLSLLVIHLAASVIGYGQEPATASVSNSGKDATVKAAEARIASVSGALENRVADYVDLIHGSSSIDLARRALRSNAQLAAARLELDRARSRLRQAGLRPNPTVEIGQLNGIFDSSRERGTSAEFSLPLELWGQRGRRIDLARAELAASEAEIADRERRLSLETRAACLETLAALRDLDLTRKLLSIEVETARITELRVKDGDATQSELNLLRAELDRLRARSELIEGQLDAAALRLKQIAGIPPDERLLFNETLDAPLLPPPPASLDAAIEIALRARPDLLLARLTEDVAQAGYRLARAQAAPQVRVFVQYFNLIGAFDDMPTGILTDRDRIIGYGFSITLPIFNHNQGAKAEAQLAITQARLRREFTESLVRAEVAAAYRRYEAAQASVQTYEQGVIARLEQNVHTMRAAYRAGTFRVSELLDEQRRLFDSHRDLTEALSERYRALSELRAAMGIID